MTHPTSSTGGTPTMATLLARVQPEPTPELKADSTATSKTAAVAAAEAKPVAAGLDGKPSTAATGPTFTAGRASSGGSPPADGTTKGVPVKRLLVWAVPLVFLVAGAALMHQSPAAGTVFLLLAFVALIVVLIAKWLGKRRATRSAASGGPGAKSPRRGTGADRRVDGGRGRGDRRGLLGKFNPLRRRGAAGGPGRAGGPAAGGRAPTGRKPPAGGPAGGPGVPGGKAGMFTKLNPFSRSGTNSGAARTPAGSKPGARTPAGGKAPGSTTGPPTRAPGGPKGLGGKLRNLLPGGSPTPGGGKSPAHGRAPSGGKASRGPGGHGGPGAAGGGNRGLLRGLFSVSTPATTPAARSPSSAPARDASGSSRFGRIRSRLGRIRNRPDASDNPHNWRNSDARWERRFRPFHRGSDVPRHFEVGDSTRTPFRDPADPANRSGRWHTREGSGYRGGGERESFATPDSGSSPRQNPDGSYNAEVVDDHEPPRPAVKVHAERVDQPAGDTSNSPRPLAPAPTGLGPATNTSSTGSSGGNTMAHTDQQTGARSASVLEAGAATARAGAARKDNIAAGHRRQAATAAGVPEMADDATKLRAQAARAAADAGARRGISAAFSQAAANHRGN